MNIDLFTSGHGEAGLLCTAEMPDLPAGVIFDAETMELTVEYLDFDPLHLNIPVEESLMGGVLMAKHMYIAYLINEKIQDTVMTPLMFLNDPYGGEFQGTGGLTQTTRSLMMFQEFMKRCNFAQAAHRESLENEGDIGSVLHGQSPKTLEFAPQLIRQQQMEMGPQGPSGPAGPVQTVSMPGMGGPKMPGMGGGGGTVRRQVQPKRPPKKSDDDKS